MRLIDQCSTLQQANTRSIDDGAKSVMLEVAERDMVLQPRVHRTVSKKIATRVAKFFGKLGRRASKCGFANVSR